MRCLPGELERSASKRVPHTLSLLHLRAEMKLNVGISNLGISVGVDSPDEVERKVTPAAPDQESPSGYYVYGHYDANGTLFYVGKGTADRPWSKQRHPLWLRYMNNHLDGQYEVKIIADGMTPEEAEEYEATFMAKQGDRLVNWINMGRSTDFKLLDLYHTLRNANRKLIQETKVIEKTDLETAAKNYKTAVEKTGEYAFMDFEHGLVGQLLKEECDEFGRNGELAALDRLTLCLIKLGRVTEADEVAAAYFERYKRDLCLKSSEKVKARVDKALARDRKSNAQV